MKGLSSFSVKRPVSILMGVLMIIILGLVALFNLTTELLPKINLPYVVVSASYPGASPELVESVIVKPLESGLATVSHLKEISAVSKEHVGMLMLEFDEGVGLDTIMLEIREKLDLVCSSFPEEVSKPMVMKLNPEMLPIMQVAVSYEGLDLAATNAYLEKELLAPLTRVPGVAQVAVMGAPQDVINITLKEEGGATPALIQNLLKGQNLEAPIGYLTDETLVRLGDKITKYEELEALPIINDGVYQVTLSDLAEITFADNKDEYYSKVNGEEALILSIQKQSTAATSKVVKALKKELKVLSEQEQKLGVTYLFDQGEYIDLTINSVLRNLIYGAVLAIIVLIFFLKQIRPTIIIGIAIPISVIATFMLIYFAGITLNLISFGGLALGVGMLVDNAIVVLENIFRLRSEGMGKREAAIKGGAQVMQAIIASTLTTVVVFLPIVFIEGMVAEIFKQLALTVSFALLASLVVALTLVPMLASKLLKQAPKRSWLDPIRRGYERVLGVVLNYKLTMILLVLFLFGGSLWGLSKMGTEYIPAGEAANLMFTLEFDEEMSFLAKKNAYDEVMEIGMGLDGVATVAGTLTKTEMSLIGSADYIYLIKDKQSVVSYEEIKAEFLRKTASLPFTLNEAMGMEMMNEGMMVQIKGEALSTLNTIGEELKAILLGIEGVKQVTSDVKMEEPALKVVVDRKLSVAHQLTNYQVYGVLNELLNPSVMATTLHLDYRPYKVNVYPAKQPVVTVDTLAALPVNGVPLNEIATLREETSWEAINRHQQSRVLTLQVGLDDDYNIGLVGEKVKNKLEDLKLPSGYEVKLTGENEEIETALMVLGKAALLAVVLVYMVMAVQFESLVYPFIIMLTVPLAATGSFLALLIMGLPLSAVALIGMIILAGIVVNNGIILVDYINQLKGLGKATREAVIKGAGTRLRPILMTSLTTILALIVMAIDQEQGAAMIRPMAIATIGGLLFATLLTLFIIPCAYVMIDNIKRRIINVKRNENRN